MEEIWRDVKGYEGKYQVSNLGRVKSLNYNRTGVERVLKKQLDKDGYECLMLAKNGKYKTCKVHRLVAEAFIPNPDGLPCVNHKDECKNNNIVTNLEWCSVAYNNAYGTHGDISKVSVFQYSKEYNLVSSYPSVRDMERITGYDHATISKCCNGKRNQAYGYLWSYTPINKAYKLF